MNDNLLGILPDMDSDAYHASPAIGSSGLKRFAVTPLHYWADFLDPERERQDTASFAFGRAWHCAVFEPKRFAADFVVMPEGLDRRTKEGKALYAELTASGAEVLSAGDAAKIERMASLARALPISRIVFDHMAAHGAAETSLFWVDPDSGVLLKIRPDYMLAPCTAFPNGLIIDGKSTTDASVAGFGRQVWNLDYGLQAALYTKVFQGVFKTAGRPDFLWLAQEKYSPHAARYYSAGEDLIQHWDRRIDAMLPAVKRCQDSGKWPGYPETVEKLALPAWAEKQMADAA